MFWLLNGLVRHCGSRGSYIDKYDRNVPHCSIGFFGSHVSLGIDGNVDSLHLVPLQSIRFAQNFEHSNICIPPILIHK